MEGILEEADRIAGQDRLEAELGDWRIAIEDRLIEGSLELEGIAMTCCAAIATILFVVWL